MRDRISIGYREGKPLAKIVEAGKMPTRQNKENSGGVGVQPAFKADKGDFCKIDRSSLRTLVLPNLNQD